ncbi:MAG: DUF3467 domain-containing protein [Planctomycetaceae bacterium]
MADSKTANPSSTTSTTAAEQQVPQGELRIVLDDSNVSALYANFCRVASTPDEVILDLALNPNPYPAPGTTGTQRIALSQRVILSHVTAKKLAALLAATLQRHEQAFGTVEVDLRKRVQVGANGDSAAP